MLLLNDTLKFIWMQQNVNWKVLSWKKESSSLDSECKPYKSGRSGTSEIHMAFPQTKERNSDMLTFTQENAERQLPWVCTQTGVGFAVLPWPLNHPYSSKWATQWWAHWFVRLDPGRLHCLTCHQCPVWDEWVFVHISPSKNHTTTLNKKM